MTREDLIKKLKGILARQILAHEEHSFLDLEQDFEQAVNALIEFIGDPEIAKVFNLLER